MRRTLLIVGGGIETIPAIQKAQEMDLRVVVSDGSLEAPGFDYVEDVILASTYKVAEMVEKVMFYCRYGHAIDGVLCIGSDVPHTVAAVAEALGIPGIPRETAYRAIDKMAMKIRFRDMGIPIPGFQQVDSAYELRKAAHWLDFPIYPLVLKPVDSRGARGVLRLTTGIDLDWAFAHSRSFSHTGRVMVEEYLFGPQVSTESVVWDGEVYTPGFADRNYEYLERFSPYIIENGGELPSHLPPETQAAIREVVKRAALALGIRRGTVKGDIVVTPEGPKVIEMAVRLSGGYFCSHSILLNTGVDFLGIAIKMALGEAPNPEELKPRFNRGVAQRFLFPEPGRVVSVTGVEEVAAHEHTALCKVYVKPGDIVQPVQSHPGRAGVVICTGEDREQARQRAIEAANNIHINTVPQEGI